MIENQKETPQEKPKKNPNLELEQPPRHKAFVGALLRCQRSSRVGVKQVARKSIKPLQASSNAGGMECDCNTSPSMLSEVECASACDPTLILDLKKPAVVFGLLEKDVLCATMTITITTGSTNRSPLSPFPKSQFFYCKVSRSNLFFSQLEVNCAHKPIFSPLGALWGTV